MEGLPLVSCVMPTYNRRQFVPHAIRYFLRQDYPNKELIVVDDGSDCVADLIPDRPEVTYFRLGLKNTLGEKLNFACRNASGSIIVHWDDDDWYANHRLAYQVEQLRKAKTQVCGLNNLLYYDFFNNKAYEYKYPSDQRKWLLGSSLCYYRAHWLNNTFKNINVGVDGLFIWNTDPRQVTVLEDISMSVHMIHDQNVSKKETSGEWWHHFPVKDIERMMKNDLDVYRAKQTKTPISIPESPCVTTNIYACLVHESLECVIDMVRNLHHNDPTSTIILFNGGGNFKPGPGISALEDFGAVWCPESYPVKHGYLHHFALDCMAFALANFKFETLTIVDSDQLSIQPGYSSFISGYLSGKRNIGLLSNRPERLTAENREVWTSIQAFEEYDLWKPLLNTFPDGPNKFVHWSFWPSTVFTYDATRDLVKQFNTNTLLQEIMGRTRIWATEEIILPTMVRLLGYEICSNPCSSAYVNYQTSYSQQALQDAVNDPEAYWIHPVPREYNHDLRLGTREYFGNYNPGRKQVQENGDSMYLLQPLQLISAIQEIEGWLSDQEAELLLSITVKACATFRNAHIVEVGSFHGKATVLLGKVAQSVSGEIRVFAVDPHDGILGASGKGLCVFAPSLERFNLNISNHGLSNTIISIVSRSADTKLYESVSLLLIDGLHDYINVNEDFRRFSPLVVLNGYVAFHDYADYYPDVQAFVNQLLLNGHYKEIGLADSLIILQKIR